MNKQHFQSVIDKVTEYAPLLVGEAQNEVKVKTEEFVNELQANSYVKVPLVGVFSAGKSSLLNVFTQKPGMLPVDTMPETAVAYELYYGTTESVELYRNGTKVDELPLADIKQLNTKPGDIARVYCKSDAIKVLQDRGIILVDMPGIGSGIERHDAAIFNYVGYGTAFVLIVDAEQGSLRGSTLAFMQELSKYNLHPAVLVSKIDKKTPEDVKDIVDYIQYQLSRLGNEHPYVSTVCAVDNNLKGLEDYLGTIEPEALYAKKFGTKLKAIVNAEQEQLKIRIDVRSKDIANVEEKIKQLDEEIANVKAELPTGNSNADTPEKSTQDILDNVAAALEAKATDIAQMIVAREDQETIKQYIVSTVRAEIINSLQEESEQYSTALGEAVQDAVKDLASIEISADFMNDFQAILDNVREVLAPILAAGNIWGKIAALLLPFLPDVLNWLFGKSHEEVIEEVRAKVIGKCVSQVTQALQPTVYKITVDNQKRIREKLQAELVSKMEKVKEGLREKIADANKSKEQVTAEISKLTEAVAQLEEAKNTL